MISSLSKPNRLYVVLVIQLIIWAIPELRLSSDSPVYTYAIPSEVVRVSGILFALTILLYLSLKIAREYHKTLCLKWAWHLMAIFAVIFLIRILVTTPLINLLVNNYYHGPIYGLLLHITVFFSKGVFIASLALMCYAYFKVGLGFHIEKRDIVMIASVFLVFIVVMVYRGNLSQARSPFEISKYLQLFAQFQTAMMAAVAIVLRRITVQMGGGKLELALRFLILHAAGSGLLVLSEVLTSAHPTELNWIIAFIENIGWQIVFWCPTFAASYRVYLTRLAEKEIELLNHDLKMTPKLRI